MLALTQKQLSDTRSALLGPSGPVIWGSARDMSIGLQPRGGKEVLAIFEALGWTTNGKLSDLGWLVLDPLREFTFWNDRHRALPCEDRAAVLQRDFYRGKKVLEVGCGSGCNLMSLSGLPEQLIGIEPMQIYLQFGSILADAAHLPQPETTVGSAENLPFHDEAFDVVLCYSSHQYMDLNIAIYEMARVLRVGGSLIIVGGNFQPLLSSVFKELITHRNLSKAKYNLFSVINTLSYEMAGRRIISGSTKNTTSQPIYPRKSYIRRQLMNAGLLPNSAESCALRAGETVTVATKALH